MESRGYLGVIGGMGPAATADFLRKLVEETPAERDQDHIPVLVWGDCRAPDRTRALLSAGPSPLPDLLNSALRLTELGARAIVVPCNTAHAWAREIGDHVNVPMLNIAEEVARLAADEGCDAMGLMATRGTLKSGIYTRALANEGIALILPTETQQTAIDLGIAKVKGGDLDAARDLLEGACDGLIAAGAGRVALACTEIPLVLDPKDRRHLDTTRALARAAVRWWRRDQAADTLL